MNDSDYPVGSFGYERLRIMREAREMVAAMPFYRRWAGRIWLRKLERMDAAMGAMIHSHQQSLVDEILTWRDED